MRGRRGVQGFVRSERARGITEGRGRDNGSLRASAAVPPLISALEADLGGAGAGGRAVVYGATGYAAGARPR